MTALDALVAIRDRLADDAPDWINRWPECFPDDPDPFTVAEVRAAAIALGDDLQSILREVLP